LEKFIVLPEFWVFRNDVVEKIIIFFSWTCRRDTRQSLLEEPDFSELIGIWRCKEHFPSKRPDPTTSYETNCTRRTENLRYSIQKNASLL
jgi:hypothetical protein